MWARTQLKIGWGDLAFGVYRSLLPPDRAKLQQRIEAFWSDRNDALVCFSVRSGFDLLLRSLNLSPGDEIVFSALNVKGMIRIAARQDFVPVPVDLDIDRMTPLLTKLEAAITPRTRAIVVAHLYGTLIDLDPIIAIARRHDILFIEDCAQVFDGRAYRGHPDSDVCMFSFGPLKTATVLGGAILTVKDAALLSRMRERQGGYPIQSNGAYLKRCLKFALLKLVTSRPVLGLVGRIAKSTGKDYEDPLSDAVRNVASLGSKKKLRQRPAAGMLALLERRLTQWHEGGLDERRAVGRRLQAMLGSQVRCPGAAAARHSYWVFPVLARNPRRLIQALRRAGFDAADLPRSQSVAAPPDRPELEPIAARDALKETVILPCYPGMPEHDLRRQAEIVNAVLAEEARGASAL